MPVNIVEPNLHTVPGINLGLYRPVELLLALIGLIIASPLIVISAAAILISSGGPVFFCQKRVGRYGLPFVLCKLRTMSKSSSGPQVTAGDDGRITSVGRFLRKTKMDELPQLWNVIKGDMSLVGPRPEVPRYVDLTNPSWRTVLAARPGITDPVTLLLRNEETLLSDVEGDRERFYLETLQPYKLKAYSEYLQRRSCWADLGILCRTSLAVVLSGKAQPPTRQEILGYLQSGPDERNH